MEALTPATTALGGCKDEDASVMQTFLESLFSTLRDDIAALKQELAADINDIRRNMGKLEQRVDSLEHTHDSHNKELEEHRHKIIGLRDKTADLNYQLEDLENSGRQERPPSPPAVYVDYNSREPPLLSPRRSRRRLHLWSFRFRG
ncbi:hypothetical protein NDU88_004744 [Pleurodeles waltl]|uniref:Uncharacterized protein n=1 Tax=Pleurodeles waltl TaxID=8319 RepID=A0AAV7VHW9_PLEWA|nr:hypothetical protein NDU88_004744 [Pleurodeles waltl]